ncbi:NAD(P)H-dependent oxidoreductase subunit E [Terasakiella sp. SH-1]|uniref:NAD(P)H-dependent oxidoreductase subunit E n=1 Tax=Terasakiella sp. SH-1 TaxID=2560057 RepID=UPI00107455D9|nr:NAD(P)H-dependent oxidoreductase subunit E [Terasakiella sp. SH-1]
MATYEVQNSNTPLNGRVREQILEEICTNFDNDKHRLMDILIETQRRFRTIDSHAMAFIAKQIGSTRIEVEGLVSFYAFFSDQPKGKFTIRLCDDIIDRFAGSKKVAQAFEDELGITFGETCEDGSFSLDYTPCIGMSDQAPAAMINDVVLTHLNADDARKIIHALREDQPLIDIARNYSVQNNIRQSGDILLKDVAQNKGLEKALKLSPADIIDIIKKSGLRGCGGAGFPTGQKWQFAAQTDAPKRYVFCNADEGEPGTFKDRVLLTKRANLLFEGMTIAARAIGADEGILYLRGEYEYLLSPLTETLQRRRDKGLLGKSFDIRIQLGAGAYICGEESALISSCEGLPGVPKTRPPFPVQSGYLGFPTIVNNVETFCHVARILDQGSDWFKAIGTEQSPGTKLLSISGDCEFPGVYETPYGLSLNELIKLAGGQDIAAIQVGGPSGELVGRNGFERRLCFEDLPTGGSIMMFSTKRNIIEIVDYFLEFFVDESCGFCTPCRVGNVFLKERIEKIRTGKAVPEDIDYLKELSNTIMKTSRCGLGQTSPNPVLSSLKNFPLIYAALVKENEDGFKTNFDIQNALEESRRLAKHRSYIYDPDFEQE